LGKIRCEKRDGDRQQNECFPIFHRS
jgi:hypothetical protein